MNRLDFLRVLIGSSVTLLSPNFIAPKSQLERERKSINRPQYQMELYHYRLQINVLKIVIALS